MGGVQIRRAAALGAAVALLLVPLLVFRQHTGAMSFYLGPGYPPGQGAYIAMRPAGHIAFCLIFLQILLGQEGRSIAHWLGLGSMIRIHRALGLSALSFAALHPLLFLTARTLRSGKLDIAATFLPPPSDYYHRHLFIGALTLYGLIVTSIAGVYGPRISPRHWRRVHALNGLLFVAAWYHGFFIGSETRYPPLGLLYTLMVIAVALLTLRRRASIRAKR